MNCKQRALRERVIHITAALRSLEIARYACGNALCIEANDAAQNPLIQGNEALMCMKQETLEITDLSSDGRGVARTAEGLVIMIAGALPGESVICQYEEQSDRSLKNGVLEKILRFSPNRCDHPCSLYSRGCNGSSLGILDYEAQLAWKENHLRETLRRIAGIKSPIVRKIIPADQQWNYRNRIELVLIPTEDDSYQPCYTTHSGAVLPVAACLLAGEAVSDVLKSMVSGSALSNANGKHQDAPRLLLHADGNGGCNAVIFIAENAMKSWKRLEKWIRHTHVNQWEIHRCKSMKSRLISSEVVASSGKVMIQVTTGSESALTCSPTVFTQTNQEQARRLVSEVLQFFSPGERLVDLYGGFGPFAIAHAQRGGKSTVIESSINAVNAGRSYCEQNRLPVRYRKMNLNHPADGRRLLTDADVIIIDPPRKGISKELLKLLDLEGTDKLIYVSCHSATMARDLSRLENYSAEFFVPIDLFPQTPDCETIALLHRLQETVE